MVADNDLQDAQEMRELLRKEIGWIMEMRRKIFFDNQGREFVQKHETELLSRLAEFEEEK